MAKIIIRKHNITPTWEVCVKIHMACLENSNSSASAKQGARDEILRLAKFVDKKIAEEKENNDA